MRFTSEETVDKMYVSQQGLWRCKFVEDVSGQWIDN